MITTLLPLSFIIIFNLKAYQSPHTYYVPSNLSSTLHLRCFLSKHRYDYLTSLFKIFILFPILLMVKIEMFNMPQIYLDSGYLSSSPLFPSTLFAFIDTSLFSIWWLIYHLVPSSLQRRSKQPNLAHQSTAGIGSELGIKSRGWVSENLIQAFNMKPRRRKTSFLLRALSSSSKASLFDHVEKICLRWT